MLPENPRSQVEARNVTRPPEKARSERPGRWNHTAERADPEQRFFIYRLCNERDLDLVATCPTPEAVGVAIVELAREGEFDECPPIGILDTQGEPGQKWLVRPWKASPRNISDAGRVLRSAQTGKGKPQ